MTTTLQLSNKTLVDIARNVAKYPPEQKQSAVMAALIAAQSELGWVSSDVIATIYAGYVSAERRGAEVSITSL